LGAIFQTFDEQISLAAAALDGLLIAGVTAIALALGASTTVLVVNRDAFLFASVQLISLALLYLMGAYIGRGYHWPTVVARMSVLYGVAVLVSGGYWSVPAFWGYVAFTWALSVTAALSLHSLFFSEGMPREGRFRRSRASTSPLLVVVGDDRAAALWLQEMKGGLRSIFHVVRAELPPPPTGNAAEFDAALRDGAEWLFQFARTHDAACVIMAEGTGAGGGWPRAIASELKLRGCAVASGRAFLERQMRAIEPSDTYEEHWTFHAFANRTVTWRVMKRALDLSIAVLLFALTSPVLLAIVAAVKLSSPGPILYRQIRVGLNGRPFVMYKFRSMRLDAETGRAPQWAAQRDPRATRVGRWLRQFHLDELPQLFNILRGDMSFVGPRPERPEFVEILTKQLPCYRIRHAVKPGLTGWAQINYPYGASVEDARRKLAFDLFYVERAGVLFDLFVVMRTARVVLLGQGAR
jgi:exopolysaccharide biosynthesis polyprenyl glycosylphosphotransferase